MFVSGYDPASKMEQSSHPSPPVKLRHLFLLVAFTLLVLWPVTTFEFVRWEDPNYISHNRDLAPPALASVAAQWDPRTPRHGPYVPFTGTVWAGLAALAQEEVDGQTVLNPRVFHAANLALHVLSVLVVFVILVRLIDRTWAAWIGAALFAIHPVQVEPVAWVSGMKEVLGGLLSLAAIWLYLEHARRRATGGGGGGGGWGVFAGASVAFILAMLSKPAMAVTVPAIVVAIEVAMLRRPMRTAAAWAAPWVVVAVIIGTMAISGRNARPDLALDFVPPAWARPIVALDALAFHLVQTLFPVRLGIDYGRSPAWLWGSPERYYTWLVPAMVAAVAVAVRNRARPAAVAAAVFALAALPALGLVSFDLQVYSTVADHHLYLAMLGVAMLGAWCVAQARGRLAAPLALALVIGLGARAFMQTWSWQDSRELFAHALRVNRRSVIANAQLADVLREEIVEGLRRGDRDGAALKFAAAMSYYRQALRRRPHDPQALTGLGDLIAMSDRPVEALPLYRKVIDLHGPSADVHAKVGRAYVIQDDRERAMLHLAEALRLDPGHSDARRELVRMREQPPTLSP
jgi:hypothetical protein